MITILAATTSETDSDEFEVARHQRPAEFNAPGLAGSEQATIQKKSADGTFFNYYLDNVLQVITATHSGVTVYGPGIYRVHKDATAASVPIEVSTDSSP